MTNSIAIPGYTIKTRLGQGAMAEVYLAVQESYQREVALKVMSPRLTSDPAFGMRFMPEMRSIAQLDHTSIVPVLEVGVHQSHHYLCMQYLPAGDLKRRIVQGAQDESLAVKVCSALCVALELAHGKGFVHRDIKPENILFQQDGTPVLTDLGISGAVEAAGSPSGMLVGTPSYMSPEQIKGLDLDARSDLYSLGIVLYEMLTGAVPFEAGSSLLAALRHADDPLPRLPPQYAAYQGFLDRLTAKDREQRFASATQVLQALGEIVAGRAGEQAPAVARATEPEADVQPVPASSMLPRERDTELHPRAIVPPASPPALHASAGPHRRARLEAMLPVLAAVLSALIGVGLISGNLTQRSPRTGAAVKPAAAVAPVPARGAVPTSSTRSHEPVALPLPPVPVTPAPQASARLAGARSLAAAVAARSAAAAVKAAAPAAVATPSRDAPQPSEQELTARTEALAARLKQDEERLESELEETTRRELQDAATQVGQRQAEELETQELLGDAQRAYAAGLLWRPVGASAADRYLAVLARQPQRPEALAGAQRLAGVLGAEAEASERAGDAATARQLIEEVRKLQPDLAQLPRLVARLQRLQETRIRPGARERNRLERVARFVASAQQNLDHVPVTYKTADVATREYDRAVAVRPDAPGLPSLKERLITAYVAAVHTELGDHDARKAAQLIAKARAHGFLSVQLEQLEASLPPVPPRPVNAER